MLDDDLFRLIGTGITSEALVGCQVMVRGGTHWAEPCFVDWRQLDEYRVRQTPWFARLTENTMRAVEAVGDDGVNNFGPNLYGIGSKTTADWLFTWLKDPKHYHHETRMPNLRLTDDEASHLTAYLLTLRNETFEALPLPEARPEVRDEMILNFMRTQMRLEEGFLGYQSAPPKELRKGGWSTNRDATREDGNR